MEEFRDIPGYEGLYQVSNIGTVKSLARTVIRSDGGKGKEFQLKERILKPAMDKKYLGTNLRIDGKEKHYKVHTLIAMAFLNHILNGHTGLVVDHIDNDSLNNNLENLQLISARKNTSKDRAGGTSQYVGVSWSKQSKKWHSRIWIIRKYEHLGFFKCELEASEAYQKALKDYELDGTIPAPKVYSSQYKGVSWSKQSKKWTAQIRINGKLKHLGSFKCELEASEAYQKALRELSA